MVVSLRQLLASTSGNVAPTVALSLFVLLGAGGIAFDYSRMATLDTEMQQAADQAALAAATQLDGGADARARATAAATQLVMNLGLFARDTNPDHKLDDLTVAFCSAYNDDLPPSASDATTAAAPNGCTLATSDADAKVAVVTMSPRKTDYAFTPVVGALDSGDLVAQAAAHVGSAICKTPPVMICNPNEPEGNTNEMLDYNPLRGTGLRLVTGSASAPGNFGWLEAGLGNSTPALAGELGYNTPQGPCQATTGVTTKTGMDAAVLNSFNTRFDVYANGNMTCPSQGGGTCSPSVNTRKDLVCDPTNDGTGCKNGGWSVPSEVYDPYWDSDGDGDSELAALPTNGSLDPDIMGYPHDVCHSSLKSRHTCDIQGDAVWDANAYFRVNYGVDETGWRGLLNIASPVLPARYDVYNWEIANPDGNGAKGINFPQPTGGLAAFSYPATGRTGVAQSSTQPDRRTIAVAVLNCRALSLAGKSTNVPVPAWLKVFLVEPAFNRGTGSNIYTDQKDIYVEFIEKIQAQTDDFTEVIRRDVPYLIK